MPDSKRSSKGFKQIPESRTETMVNPNDATIDIPLHKVETKTGARRTSWEKRQDPAAEQQLDEKAGFYQRHVAGRRKAAKKTGHKGEDGEEDTLNRMGIVYNKILEFSIVTRYFLYVLPLAIIISIPIVIGATAAKNATIGGVRIVWIFSWLLIVWLSLWVSKLVAKCLPSIFQFLCGIVSSGTRKYALVIRALEIYLSLCGWALASLATFIPVMTRNPTQRAQSATFSKYQNSTVPAEKSNALLYRHAAGVKEWQAIVQRILAALLVASLILLAEKLLIQLISIGYHRTQFNAKIKDSKHKIHLLSLLYDASRILFPAYCREFADEDYIINASIELGESKNSSGHQRSGSATPMRLLHNVGRFGDKLTSAFGNIAHEVTGKQVFNPNSAHSVVVEALEKNKSSEALAKRLWMSFVVEGKEALYREDIIEVLGADRHDEAEEAFAVLDRDSNGDISLDEMVLTVCDFGKERHSIANSLHDVDQAINVLDKLLCTIVFIMVIFVFVAFLNSSFTTTLATAGTALLSLSFVFAGTAQEVLGSCIFLFVKHPFDVLDRVDIGEDQLVVKHISLLFTVFKHVKNHKLTQVPNVTLNTLWIQNVSRSEAMREQLLIYISFDTTLEDIQLLKNEMHAFVTDKENSRDFQPDIDVEITGIAAMDKLELKVEIRHKSNWSNETVRAARRSKFMCALVLALRKIPINAPGGGAAVLGSADQPSYSVSVSDEQAAASRDAFDKAKEAKRLFPTKKSDLPDESPTRGISSSADSSDPRDSATPPPLKYRQRPSESAALSSLNTRHPAADTANNPKDIIEQNTFKPLTRSVSGDDTPPDHDRSVSIEEVRGMLRRQSTRGKRRPSVGVPSTIDPIAENTSKLLSTYTGSKFEYDPCASTSQAQIAQNGRKEPESQSTQQATPPLQEERQSSWPQPPINAYATHPTNADQQRPSPPSQSFQSSQVTAIVPPSQVYTPAPPPKDTPHTVNNSKIEAAPQLPSQRPFSPSDPAELRSASPVRNNYQIHALRAQGQGGGIPRAVRADSRLDNRAPGSGNVTGAGAQARRHLPGSGNTSAAVQLQERAPGAVVRPARGDSLGGRKLREGE
ncbi:MAG: hypothetical protein Q9217_004178 [Psora testacea]